MFEALERLPADPILGLAAACKADPNPHKVDVTVGVYMDEAGATPVPQAIKLAQQELVGSETTKVYMPQVGDADFNRGMQELMLGADSNALSEARVTSVQAPGGSGALRLCAEVVKIANPDATIWVSDPTWPNHVPLLGATGLKLRSYRYYASATHSVDFEAMLEDLQQVGRGDLVLLHGCCHNPCGADLDQQQWGLIAALAARNGFTPFVDFAYQGLGDGLEADAAGLRQLVAAVPEVLIAGSCSKNLGLYRERTGAALFVSADPDAAIAAQTQATAAARRIYSMPPAHGAILAGRVLTDARLNALWREELEQMCGRINGLRLQLVEKLNAATGEDFGFIAREKGMFSFLGISAEQVKRLREEHSVYMVGSSRMNIAGLRADNMDYFAAAVAKVL
ncbi:aspartate/tyrosine/aromatic aminotransferase [Halieaceae bacterium IMCC14734]|uniref:Aspartate/tyrosine/aromatic aminotransferase n=1 Tax=Candidatus Litorirhabdus singularis TaxID=2518993 RepID=A0ABT3TJ69_9GAMM|nr:aspartate/tyrosine/aromatic aminotransferase [Candidatus Litorirhabdus singularis]MCX2982357.1 aspartate/tyrosine/aromatic aminotransferase [Candidatus Litorirhabdus singularis]